MEGIKIDLGSIITAISLVIGSVATFIVALRSDKKNESGEEKAISVTKINETDKKVEVLIGQVDFLFEEISRLRAEKDSLEKKIALLNEELQTERDDHAATKIKLAEAVKELGEKSERLKALEEKHNVI